MALTSDDRDSNDLIQVLSIICTILKAKKLCVSNLYIF